MGGMRFLDTNILVYSVCAGSEEGWKAERAKALLKGRELLVSVQVLQEFYVQATRPTRPGRLTHGEAVGLIRSWLRFPVQPLTVPVMQAALDSRERYSLSYWDALIIETARAAGCREILSEDMSDGRDYAGVRIVNPFA